jgi:hypothetical protein
MPFVLLLNYPSPPLLLALRLLGHEHISLGGWDGIGCEPVLQTV